MQDRVSLAVIGLRFGRHVIDRIASGEGREHIRVSAAHLSLVMGDASQRRQVATQEVKQVSGEYQWAEFAQAVRKRSLLDEATVDAIVDGIRIVKAMAESERTGRAVDLPASR